ASGCRTDRLPGHPARASPRRPRTRRRTDRRHWFASVPSSLSPPLSASLVAGTVIPVETIMPEAPHLLATCQQLVERPPLLQPAFLQEQALVRPHAAHVAARAAPHPLQNLAPWRCSEPQAEHRIDRRPSSWIAWIDGPV